MPNEPHMPDDAEPEQGEILPEETHRDGAAEDFEGDSHRGTGERNGGAAWDGTRRGEGFGVGLGVTVGN